MYNIVFGVIIVFLLLFIWVGSIIVQRDHYNKIIEGLWIGDDDFCRRAYIDKMYLYIGPDTDENVFSETRKAILVMYAADNPTVCELNLTIYDYLFASPLRSVLKKKLHITGNNGIENLMPESMDIEICIPDGSMLWSGYDDDDEEVVYASLYKSHNE